MIHQSSIITTILHNRLQLNLCAANNTHLFSAHGVAGCSADLPTHPGVSWSGQLGWGCPAPHLPPLRPEPQTCPQGSWQSTQSKQKHTSFRDLRFEPRAAYLASFHWPAGATCPHRSHGASKYPLSLRQDLLSHMVKGIQVQPGVKLQLPHGINGIQHANAELDLQSRLFTR